MRRDPIAETLQPAPNPPAPRVTIDQYLALRGVPEHRRVARRALAGRTAIATVEEFDALFARAAR